MLTEVPDLKPYLLPDEVVEKVERHNIKRPEKHPSSLKALTKLAGVASTSEIGTNGPVVASRTTKENEGTDGLGLFETPFGRDSLTAALLLHRRYPKLTKSTIRKAAEIQGVTTDLSSEEEPGKIFHEERRSDDPKAKEGMENGHWKFLYYGSVDSTPLFIQAIAYTARDNPDFLKETYVGKDGQPHNFEHALNQAVGWLEQHTKQTPQNPERLLEFKRLNIYVGILNQAWKDSGDSYMHADGTLANHEKGIASIEVQVLAYDALIDAAETYERLQEALPSEQYYSVKARQLKNQAVRLRRVILDTFWVEDERGGYFALGSDRDQNNNLRIMKVRTSNMGRLLHSRALEGDDPEVIYKREALIKTLFSPEMLAASGIRTLSSRERRFKPGSYHNGSVWLYDTYLIALGLDRHGYFGLSEDLKQRIGKVVEKFHKFPEFARGGDESEPVLNERTVDILDENIRAYNRIEQPPQEIQAWSVAAILAEKFDRDPLRLQPPKPTTALDLRKRQLELELLPAPVLQAV